MDVHFIAFFFAYSEQNSRSFSVNFIFYFLVEQRHKVSWTYMYTLATARCVAATGYYKTKFPAEDSWRKPRLYIAIQELPEEVTEKRAMNRILGA